MSSNSLRGLAGALSLVATVAALTWVGGRVQWEVVALAAILSVPLYVVTTSKAAETAEQARRESARLRRLDRG
jgi:hypothetical protein